jgi:hypothetical protein
MRVYLIAVAIIMITSVACGSGLPFKVITSKNSICFDVQTLGEYFTPIYRIRLIEDAGRVIIWELQAKSVSSRYRPQIWTFTLVAGANAPMIKDVAHGEYEVVYPRDKKAFLLIPGKHYTIKLWGAPHSVPRQYKFMMPG